MSVLLYFAAVFCLVYFGIKCFLPKIVAWYLIRKYNIQIHYGQISFPCSLRDVKILKNGYSLHVEEISVRSSFFNSDVTKLLSINIRHVRVRVHKDVTTTTPTTVPTVPTETNAKPFWAAMDFRNKKVPPSIMTFAQFIAVHVHHISVVVVNRSREPSWFLHATVAEMHLDGSIVQNAKSLIVTAALDEAEAKILRYYPPYTNTQPTPPTQPDVCLVELSFGIALDGVLIAHGQPSLEKIHLNINHTKTTVHDGLYDFIRDTKIAKRRATTPLDNPPPIGQPIVWDAGDLYDRISPIIPKNFLVKIESARISAKNQKASDDFSATLKSFTITGKFTTNTLSETYQLPSFDTELTLHHLQIDTKHERFLFVEQFTIDTKIEQDVLNAYFKLNTFQLIYNHTEIYDWMRSNIFTYAAGSPGEPTPLSMILPKPKSTLLQAVLGIAGPPAAPANFVEWLMARMGVKGCAELWNISVVAKLDHQTASASVSHTKLLLEQFDERRSAVYHNRVANLLLHNRHWSTDLMIKSLWWSLGSSTRDHNPKKTHIRGTPFFLKDSLIKLSSYGNATKLVLSVNTLRVEYSACLAEFMLKLYECAQLYGYRKAPRPIRQRTAGAETSAAAFRDSAILVNAKITNVKTFLFNHHDACILVDLAEVSLDRAAQITVLQLDGFKTAIMVASSDQSVIKQHDFTDVFSNEKLIRIEFLKMIEVPQYNVHVLNDSKAMWNTNFYMHIVTLVQDMLEFKEAILPAPVELDIGQPTSSSSSASSALELGCADRATAQKPSAILKVYAEGDTKLGIRISERHSMKLRVKNFYLTIDKIHDVDSRSHVEEISVQSNVSNINIEQVHVRIDVTTTTVPTETNAKPFWAAMDFKKVPPSIMTFAQFIAASAPRIVVHVHQIEVERWNRSREPNWIFYAHVDKMHLDGSIVQNDKSLIVTAALDDVKAIILRYYPKDSTTQPTPPTKMLELLIELSFGIALDGVLIAHGQPSLEKIHLNINHTKTTVHDGLYDFIRDTNPPPIVQPIVWDAGDLYDRISLIIPKNFLVNIESVRISAKNLSDTLKSIKMSGKFTTKKVNEDWQPLPNFEARITWYLEIDSKHVCFVQKLDRKFELFMDLYEIHEIQEIQEIFFFGKIVLKYDEIDICSFHVDSQRGYPFIFLDRKEPIILNVLLILLKSTIGTSRPY